MAGIREFEFLTVLYEIIVQEFEYSIDFINRINRIYSNLI